ncbi:hypothetical protein ACFXPY_46665 [Streptomyces sp. NPDC059153]|uniref:hypothetical protein n=1 Tax=Streptomyces sp. NPDC059153 TaxID=3346743 RepID=UPI003697E13B
MGYDRRAYLDTHDGRSWSTWYVDNLGWAVDQGVALAPHRSHLWRIATGRGSSLHVSTSDGGAEWHNQGTRDPWKASHYPALATQGDTMSIFLGGLDGDLRGHLQRHVERPEQGQRRSRQIDGRPGRRRPRQQRLRDVPPLTPSNRRHP